MVYVLKIAAYVMITLVSCAVCGRFLTMKDGLKWSFHTEQDAPTGIGAIVLSSVLYGWYATICSPVPYNASDRLHYVSRFVDCWRKPWSPGLNAIGDFLHLFTNNPHALFFLVTFLCVLVTLWAYRTRNGGYREALLFWASSTCTIESFYLLKQAPAIAFGTLSIILLMKDNFRYRYIACAAALAAAVSFHETALILIPIYCALFLTKWKWIRWASYLLVAVGVLFFGPVSRIAFSIIEVVMPPLFEQVSPYLDETGAMSFSLNVLTPLKGFPYFLITAYGFWNRPRLKDEIRYYDWYLMLSVCASAFFVLSAYMYWMWRFGTYCYFPMYIFASELYRKASDRRLAQVFFGLVLSSLAFFTLRYLFQCYFLYGGF